MMVIVVAPKVPLNIKKLVDLKDCFIIAVDRAVEDLNRLKIHYDLAIGDFDSLQDEKTIKSEQIKLNVVKDESDTFEAIAYAYEKSDTVILVGGLQGNRIDHLYANLLLFQKYPNLTIIDDHNKISSRGKGTHSYDGNDYDYISIFAIKDALITLTGTKYLLTEYQLKKDNPLGLSNEIITKAIIEVIDGVVLVIQSKD